MAIKLSVNALLKSLCLLFFAFAASTLQAATIRVPADQPTIQAGINAAATGDTVLVSPGTYYENIDFKGKAITVISSDGATKTIIDGSATGPVVSFLQQETRAATISGFTIRNGGSPSASGGTGGILVGNATPTILNNLITANRCYGININFGAPLIQGNTISLNHLLACGSSDGSGVLIGGGYYQQFQVGSATVLAPTLLNNTIEQNVFPYGIGGGGIEINGGGNPVIEDNIIRNNSTPGSGGAIFMVNTQILTLAQNLIYNNHSGTGGGGIYLVPPSATQGPFVGILANNTIVGNTVSSVQPSAFNTPASQVYLEGNLAQFTFTNNVVVGADSYPAFLCGTVYNYLSITPLVIDHNDIFNSQGSAYGGACADQTGTYGNLSVDPLFVNPGNTDFHLRAGSPAIDSGNSSVPQLSSKDLDSNVRLQDATGKGYPIVDMGAYEAGGQQNANATFLTLSPSAYRISGATSLTLNAKLLSATGIPTGTLTYFEDNQQIGASTIDSTGAATFTVPSLAPGIHAFVAYYAGQGGFTPAISVKIFVLVEPYTVTLKLTSSSNPSIVGQIITLSVTVSSMDNAIPTPVVLSDFGHGTLATLFPDQNGQAGFNTSSLTLGTHNITATYAGDATHASANDQVVQQVVTGYLTNITLSCSPNPTNIFNTVTLAATVTASNGAPTGTITYTEGATVLATQTLLNGSATATTSSLTAGSHTITATYNPAGAFGGSSGTCTQTIVGKPTTTSLTVNPTLAYALQPVTLSATISTGTATTATGSVAFYDGAITLGSAALDATGHATLLTSTLTAGNHPLRATYNGDATFTTSSSNPVSVAVQLNPTATTLTIAPSPSTVANRPIAFTVQVNSLTSVPFSTRPCPGCTVTLTVVGLPANLGSTYVLPVVNGSATFNFGLGLGAGIYSFTATFNGSPAFAASTSAPTQETVVPAPTTLSLSASPNLATQNQAVSLTATFTAPSSVLFPVGTITFLDGTTPFATAAVGSTGPVPVGSLTNTTTATITTTTLAPGSHSITVNYPGSSNFLPATSSPITVIINPQDFVISATPTVSIQAEHHTTTPLTLSSIGSFSGTVSLSCGNLPIWLTCTFTPSSATLIPNGTASTSLYLDTDAVIGYATNDTRSRPSFSPATPISLALLLPFGLLLALRRRRLPVRLLVFALTTLATALTLSGCSGLYPPHTQPGTYIITITGTSGSLTHTTNITLKVTP